MLALGHPGGFDLRRSLVVRLGRIIRWMPGALQTDCTISPGDSGGPLFDMHGRVIGIHSAISTSMAENFHVAVTAFYEGWDLLAKGARAKDQAGQPRAYVGATGVDDADGCRLTEVDEDSPAAKAGLKPGDVVAQGGRAGNQGLCRLPALGGRGRTRRNPENRGQTRRSSALAGGQAGAPRPDCHDLPAMPVPQSRPTREMRQLVALLCILRDLASGCWTGSAPSSRSCCSPGWAYCTACRRAGFFPRRPRSRATAIGSGEETLRAFAPMSEATRYSIVKFNVDGATVALGTVVDTNGLALTKASELKKGKLTCWLAIEKEVDAELIGTDEEEDVALVRVHAAGLEADPMGRGRGRRRPMGDHPRHRGDPASRRHHQRPAAPDPPAARAHRRPVRLQRLHAQDRGHPARARRRKGRAESRATSSWP